MRIVVTGAHGLIGWHTCVRLHAVNCLARFLGNQEVHQIEMLGRREFNDDEVLSAALSGADAVLHFAGVNRASDKEIMEGNPAIANRLVEVCSSVQETPHIVYANSIHSETDTVYGISKRKAGEILSSTGGQFTDLVLPHIFGECARPNYNNVTATLIAGILAGDTPRLDANGRVNLLHAGAAAQYAIDAAILGTTGRIVPEGRFMSVSDLYTKLCTFHAAYVQNIYPNLDKTFDRDLFNSYRSATYPDSWPRPLKLNTDTRGTLFEAVKGGSGGQTFLSTTRPGVTRGNHFHLGKVERFLVVQGDAVIRVRKVLSERVWEFPVSGDVPAPVDMPTLHTHSIENTGDSDLITLFWTHDLFDPSNPDTYADEVYQ